MTLEKEDKKARRTGGRSARVRTAVLRAAMEELAEKGMSRLSIPGIAERAGVHPTSIYRRWETVEMLALDAALDAAGSNVPVPDTGSLHKDLLAFLEALDTHIRSPLGKVLLALSGLDTQEAAEARSVFWKERLVRASVIFERAIRRGEIGPDTNPEAAVELAIAPLYLRALVMQSPPDKSALPGLVDTICKAFAPDQPA